MKKMIAIVVMSAAMALTGTGIQPRVIPVNSDAETTPVEGPPKTKPPAPALAPVPAAPETPEPALAPLNEQLAEANAQLSLANAQIAEAAAAGAASSEEAASAMSGSTSTFHPFARHGFGSGNALVVRSSDFDSKAQSALEEDLPVMSHILEKALEDKFSGQPHARKAMGIDVVFSWSSNPIRSLYLDGYGAVFFLNVSFPLVQPPKSEPRKEPAETSSTWEEARQEIYGQRVETKPTTAPAEEYDQDKVNKLKDAILDALKNSSNIRELKADDSVTVCIFGGAGRSARTAPAAKRGSGFTTLQNYVWVLGDSRTGRARGTVLTIRVRKADADAFAKGKLDLDEFRKKAKMTSYGGTAMSEGGVMSLGGTGSGYEYWRQ